MAYYLCQVSYNAEGWAALLKKPHNRIEAVRRRSKNWEEKSKVHGLRLASQTLL